jgi:hypothetical protein
MKLFKSLLVAPAALGLLAPMAATANEVTVNDFNPVIENTLLAGGEGLVDDHSHDGSFSETTTASFSADMAIGAVDGGTATTDDALEAYYGFQIDLNTSFTGEDSLDISIDAGNAGGAVTEFDLNGGVTTATDTTTTDILTVDGVSYTFPLGGATVFVGDNTDGSALFSTACVYGGPSNTLDDCGNVNAAITGGGTAFGASYDFDNGLTAAVGYAGQGSTTSGLLTEEGLDSYGANVAYTGDSYGVSVTFGSTETDEVAHTDTDTYTALNAYWTPEGFPSISAGYEWGTDGSAAATADESTSYFIGIQFDEAGPGTLGAAMGTKTPTVEDTEDLLMYEAFYSYPINDGMTITPLVYIKEFSGSTDDETGIMVKTSFSF